TVGVAMLAMEIGLDLVEPELAVGHRDVELEGLAAVAEIERAEELLLLPGEAFPLELLAGRGLHLREGLAERGEALPERAHPRANVVVLDVGGEQAERGEVARVARHEDPRD